MIVFLCIKNFRWTEGNTTWTPYPFMKHNKNKLSYSGDAVDDLEGSVFMCTLLHYFDATKTNLTVQGPHDACVKGNSGVRGSLVRQRGNKSGEVKSVLTATRRQVQLGMRNCGQGHSSLDWRVLLVSWKLLPFSYLQDSFKEWVKLCVTSLYSLECIFFPDIRCTCCCYSLYRQDYFNKTL